MKESPLRTKAGGAARAAEGATETDGADGADGADGSNNGEPALAVSTMVEF
jgi:hypothetical protein